MPNIVKLSNATFWPDRKNYGRKVIRIRVDVLRKIRRLLYVDDFNRIQQRRSGGVSQPEVPEHPDTDYNRINGTLFITLRTELGE